jgi:hypothetical protein
MSKRIVLLGYGGDALELEPLDADVLEKEKNDPGVVHALRR